MRLQLHATLLTACLFWEAWVVSVENGPLKCMLLAGTVGHLQYPPTGACDIEHRSQDLDHGQTLTLPVARVYIPSTSICNSVSLPKGGIPFRYLRTRPSPDNIRVRTRAASAKPASKVHDIFMLQERVYKCIRFFYQQMPLG